MHSQQSPLCNSDSAAPARQALTESQLIAVLEVRNLTGDPAAAGMALCSAVIETLVHTPLNVNLHEAAASQSRIELSEEGPPGDAPGAPGPQAQPTLAAEINRGSPIAAPIVAHVPARTAASAPSTALGPRAAWVGLGKPVDAPKIPQVVALAAAEAPSMALKLRATANRTHYSDPLRSALVVLNLTFASADDAVNVRAVS